MKRAMPRNVSKQERGKAPDKGKGGGKAPKLRKTAMDELDEFSAFVRMFGFLVNDGYTPDSAVSMLAGSAGGNLKKASNKVLGRMQNGVQAAEAFREPGYFPEEFCSVIGVGESTGNLGEAMSMYGDYIEKVLQMRKGLQSALSYPTVLLSFVLIMVAVILFFIAPKFVEMLSSMGADRSKMPAISGILFVSYDFSKLVGKPVIVAIIGVMTWWLLLGGGKAFITRMLDVVPKIRETNNKLSWAQWLMMGAICMQSGMLVGPMLETLSKLPLPRELAGKKKGVVKYRNLQKNVSLGKPLSNELRLCGAPNIIPQMIGASEKSGRMGEAIRSIAAQYLYTLTLDIKVIGTIVEQLSIAVVVLFGGGIVSVVAITMMSITKAVA